MAKTKRGNFKSCKRKENNDIQRELSNTISCFLQQKLCRPDGKALHIKSAERGTKPQKPKTKTTTTRTPQTNLKNYNQEYFSWQGYHSDLKEK